MRYGYDFEPLRQTEDIDIALTVPDWEALAALRERLVKDFGFAEEPGIQHRLRYRQQDFELPIDIVPFGELERSDRTIAWPPSGDPKVPGSAMTPNQTPVSASTNMGIPRKNQISQSAKRTSGKSTAFSIDLSMSIWCS